MDGRRWTADCVSSCRRPAAVAASRRRPLFPGRLRVANQQSAAAKGNPLFSTPVIISIRCLARPSLAMISTFKWQRQEGKTNVGALRQGHRGRDGEDQELKARRQLVSATCQSSCKKTNHLSNHVEGETRVSNTNGPPKNNRHQGRRDG